MSEISPLINMKYVYNFINELNTRKGVLIRLDKSTMKGVILCTLFWVEALLESLTQERLLIVNWM